MAGQGSEEAGQGGGQQSMLASQRAKEQGEATGRFSKWFPLSAKSGFDQWWAGLSPMATEHRVLSFIPHLQSPPTHTQTGASAAPSSTDLNAPPKHSEDQTTTNATNDPLGGYLAIAYALKYPGHLNKLILASPVGIPEDPYAVDEEMPDPQESSMANEFTQDAAETNSRGVQPITADKNNFMNQQKKGDTTKDTKQPPKRRLPWWLYSLWEANMISPFTFVRWSGPLGPRLVSGWTSRRFSQLPEEEAQALHDYSYALFRQRGSSEYALGYLLAPGAFARSPMIRRIQGVGRQWIQAHDAPTVDGDAPPIASANSPQSAAAKRETGYPVVFMYGENDWMDVAGGFAAEEKMKLERERLLASASPEERNKDHGVAKVVIINKAGHHVYLDGWEQFNRVMLEEMDEVRRRQTHT
ncbi:conserved hypothetical protein [Pyrenophora tritici-repentis Pt-1C-BFP]|uniref:Uncharacterized protein n=1 Tax=Pyrenophora tritici-repentis (strain Pt-1C-BFP) TaxID=426418 RepID=B2W5G8_PYRTR|nr:uncharacterized protein PTRG_04868 [Pyrenophora tritici-repentis Pt-1C-BFP]EDU47775.1 conserved hypothetical protein [Pyrenophora tritici-repentis Pt-1C-BFP]